MAANINQTRLRPQTRALNPRANPLLGRFLREWVWPRRLQIAIAIALTSLVAAVTGLYPFVIKQTFDRLMSKDASALPLILTAIICVSLLRSLLMYLQAAYTNRVVMRMTNEMQKSLLAHVLRADFARLVRDAPGQLVSRMTNDVAVIQTASQSALYTTLRDVFSVVALTVAMIYLDPLLSLVVLVIYPLAALPILSIGRRMRNVARRTQNESGNMLSLLTEKVSSARLIKTYRLETYAAKLMNRSFDEILKLRMKAVLNRARLDPLLEALGAAAVAGVVAVAFWRVSGTNATVGDFMGFATALLMAAQPIRSIGNLNTRVQEGLAALERYYEVVDETPAIHNAPDAAALQVPKGEIRFENVSFTYETADGRSAVHDFSLTIPGGKTVALVGRSGSGKSTIVNLVPRLFDVAAGRITIDGQDIRNVTLESLRDSIAIVSQDVTLFDDTVRANILLGRLDATMPEVVSAAKAAAAHDFILQLPRGYGAEIGESGSRLSGGQRQRIALARAILKDAPILLLDEPTSSLDAESERLVQGALAKFTRNRTTIVIAHRLATVQKADVICVIDKGTAVEIGTHQQLIARDGIYAQLCRSQVLESADPTQGDVLPMLPSAR